MAQNGDGPPGGENVIDKMADKADTFWRLGRRCPPPPHAGDANQLRQHSWSFQSCL